MPSTFRTPTVSESGSSGANREFEGRQYTNAQLISAVVRPILAGVILLVGYFLLPINRESDVKLVGFICGALLLAGFVFWEVRHFIHSKFPVAAALEMLVALATFYIVSFATMYFMFSEYADGSFTVRLTRVDALYFSLTVFTTTGFGDITPATQAARIAVSVQMASSFILLGLGIRFLTVLVESRRKSSSQGDDD